MLKSIKYCIKNLFSYFGYEIQNKKKYINSDNPFKILSKITETQEIITVIDAGASIGKTSKQFTEIFPNANVHAVEPYPPFFKLLKNESSKNKKIKVHNFAFSNSNGFKSLTVNNSEGTNSLLPTSKNSQHFYGDLLTTNDKIEVKTFTLDSFLESQNLKYVDVLKLDLQGYELMALQGGAEALKNNKIGIILCEIIFEDLYQGQNSPYELLNFLVNNYSFKLFNLYQKHYHHGQLIQTDAILIHTSFMDRIEEKLNNNFFHIPI